MEKAIRAVLEEAEKAYKKGEVPVGAVVVRNREIISRGHNQRITKNNAILHAEIVAISEACKKLGTWRLDDCELWVSLEPCVMCAGAIMQARIKNVNFLAEDKKGGAIMNKYTLFDDDLLPFNVDYHYIPVKEASDILKKFFQERRKKENI